MGPSEVTPNRPLPISVRRPRSGFTLIEVMVVVVIVAIASGIAIPAFVGSMRGAKLKVATRAITMTSRLARSTAVLQGEQMAILFFQDHGEIELIRIQNKTGRNEQSMFLEGRDSRRVEKMLEEDEEEAAGPPSAVRSEMVRHLPDGIRILEVEVNGGDSEFEGVYWVNFYPNGMSDKYVLTLVDETDRQAKVTIDPISGKVRIEYER